MKNVKRKGIILRYIYDKVDADKQINYICENNYSGDIKDAQGKDIYVVSGISEDVDNTEIEYYRFDGDLHAYYLLAEAVFVYAHKKFCDPNTVCYDAWKDSCEEDAKDPAFNEKYTNADDDVRKCQIRLDYVQDVAYIRDLGLSKPNLCGCYDCKKLMFYYTCKYICVYCSEMLSVICNQMTFRNELMEPLGFDSFWDAYPFFNILSFGCGEAADLLAFDYARTSNFYNFQDKPLCYTGYDLSEDWSEIQDFIKENIRSAEVCFNNKKDVVKCVNDPEEDFDGYNVLIMQYLLSILEKQYTKEELRCFFNKLVDRIISKKCNDTPFMIIINDVAQKSTYDLLKEELQCAGFSKVAFLETEENTDNEEMNADDEIAPYFPEILNKYSRRYMSKKYMHGNFLVIEVE